MFETPDRVGADAAGCQLRRLAAVAIEVWPVPPSEVAQDGVRLPHHLPTTPSQGGSACCYWNACGGRGTTQAGRTHCWLVALGATTWPNVRDACYLAVFPLHHPVFRRMIARSCCRCHRCCCSRYLLLLSAVSEQLSLSSRRASAAGHPAWHPVALTAWLRVWVKQRRDLLVRVHRTVPATRYLSRSWRHGMLRGERESTRHEAAREGGNHVLVPTTPGRGAVLSLVCCGDPRC